MNCDTKGMPQTSVVVNHDTVTVGAVPTSKLHAVTKPAASSHFVSRQDVIVWAILDSNQ